MLADLAQQIAKDIEEVGRPWLPMISGAMFHCNCENDDFDKFSVPFSTTSDERYRRRSSRSSKWVSLGGGILAFTKEGYPLDAFCDKLAAETVCPSAMAMYRFICGARRSLPLRGNSGYLVTQRALDIVQNDVDIAIVDAAVETHMLDLLIYRTDAKIEAARRSPPLPWWPAAPVLAGDVFRHTIILLRSSRWEA